MYRCVIGVYKGGEEVEVELKVVGGGRSCQSNDMMTVLEG